MGTRIVYLQRQIACRLTAQVWNHIGPPRSIRNSRGYGLNGGLLPDPGLRGAQRVVGNTLVLSSAARSTPKVLTTS
jgi:hypothetical protein